MTVSIERRRLGGATLALVALFCALGQASPAAAAGGRRAIVVDASKTQGPLKALRGVSGVPDLSFAAPLHSDRGPPRAVDVSAGYREAAINLVRTHDSEGAGDIDSSKGPLPPSPVPGMGGGGDDRFILFPDLKADPADPKSYNFGPTDVMVRGIRKIDAEVILRLGRGVDSTAEPPRDLAKYREIVRHIVLHYNKGWANGFQNAVKYWEIWNEPDLGHIWWRGTPEEYYAFYGAAAKAVKAADPQAMVGGPTIALVNEKTAYREGFLDYAAKEKLPLDFYPWHYYSDANDPYDFVRISKDIRRVLDERGFIRTVSFLDEWNMGLGAMMGGRVSPATRAAFVVSSSTYMQDAPIDHAAYYRADNSFDATGKATDKVGQALIALGRLAKTPVRLAAMGADTNGLAVQAGRSADGRTVQVLISNYQIAADQNGPRKGPDMLSVPKLFDMALPPRRTVTYDRNDGYDLSIGGLTAGEWTVERYRLTDARDFALIDSTSQSGATVRLSADLPAPGVELVVLHRK